MILPKSISTSFWKWEEYRVNINQRTYMYRGMTQGQTMVCWRPEEGVGAGWRESVWELKETLSTMVNLKIF